MESPQVWKQSLQNKPDKKEVIIEMVSQIKKDFGMFSENIEFNEKATEKYSELHKQLERYLNIHFSQNTERLYPILYRIDILEKDIQTAINQQDSYNFIGAITQQIIIKELKKVLIRRHYKEKEKK